MRREKIARRKLERNVRCCLLLASHVVGVEDRQRAQAPRRLRKGPFQGRLDVAPPSPPRSNSSTSGSTHLLLLPCQQSYDLSEGQRVYQGSLRGRPTLSRHVAVVAEATMTYLPSQTKHTRAHAAKAVID